MLKEKRNKPIWNTDRIKLILIAEILQLEDEPLRRCLNFMLKHSTEERQAIIIQGMKEHDDHCESMEEIPAYWTEGGSPIYAEDLR